MIGVGSEGPVRTVGGSGRAADRWSSIDTATLDAGDERPYWIALATIPGLGQVNFARLVTRYGSARRAWDAGDAALEDLPRLPPDATALFRRLRREGARRVALRVEAATTAAQGRVLTMLDDGYPAALRRLDPRPPAVHLAGDPQALDATCVAIVGTRRPSGYGRSCAVEIADELARAGVTVVSGLALGIDGEAHRAAVAAGGRSVAVLPTPLDRIYPPRHRDLARQLVQTGGALITELATGQAVGRPDFARRNRVIAGLSQAVVVIEAPDHSGALLTAAAAIQIGKELYAVPGQIDAVASRGCNRLIADHLGTIVTSPPALLQQIGVGRATSPIEISSLSDAEGLVLAALLARSGSIEELIDRTRLATGALAGCLTLLEARGLITSYGGATFHPTLAARRLERAS